MMGLLAAFAVSDVSPPSVYVALGGSNTCGHFVRHMTANCTEGPQHNICPICRNRHCIFFRQLANSMQRERLVGRSVNNCVPAMGTSRLVA
jgi:hypothetical protein